MSFCILVSKNIKVRLSDRQPLLLTNTLLRDHSPKLALRPKWKNLRRSSPRALVTDDYEIHPFPVRLISLIIPYLD